MAEMILKMSGMVAFYIVLTVLMWKRFGNRKLSMAQKLLIGLIYALCAMVSTHFGVSYGHMVLNVRDIAPLLAGLLFHPVSGVIAGVLGGVERYIAGTYFNVGSYTRIACSLSTILAGLLTPLFSLKVFEHSKRKFISGVFIGAVMEVFHMYVVIITHRYDINMAYYVIQVCSIPMIVFTSLGLATCCLVVRILDEGWEQVFRKKKPHEIPLSQSFQQRMLMTITLIFVAGFFISYMAQSRMALEMAQEQILEVTTDILDAHNRFHETQNSMESYFKRSTLSKAKAVAASLRSGAEAGESYLNELKELYDFESLKVVDAPPEGEEVKVENRRVKAWAPIEGGAVEVVMDPDVLARQINLAGLDETLSSLRVGTFGGFDIFRNSGIITAGRDRGMSLTTDDLVTVNQHTDGSFFMARMFYTDLLCRVDRINDETSLLVFMPLDEVFSERSARCYESAFEDILLVAIIYLMIAFLVDVLVVTKLDVVNASLGKITDGQLDEAVNVRSCSEFNTLSDDINKTVDVLKGYIDAAKSRIEKELKLARDIQDAALPKNFMLPRNDIELYALMNPAREVGGDFYDFFFIEGNRLALVIADVSGKGIPAALFMMRGKTAIRSMAQAGCTPAEILYRANETLCDGNDAEMFITAWVGIIDLETGRMQCSNAGHEYPVLMRAGEDYALMKDRHGLALAAMEGVRYKDYEIEFNPGDRLFVYTDGVPEAIDEEVEQYGTDRMIDKLNETKHLHMEEVLPAVRLDISVFAGKAEQFDDITMLGFVYYGTGEGRNQP